MSPSYFLFDLGGTKTRVAVSRDGVNLSDIHIFNTPENYDQALTLLAKTARELVRGPISKACGGLPGQVKNSRLYVWNNLSNWKGKNVEVDLKAKLNCSLILENDTALAGLGEAVSGAGKNKNIVAYVTISTGANGVRIVNKQIDASARGFEIGRQIIDFGSGKTWEEEVSGRFISLKHNKPARSVFDKHTWDEVSQKVGLGLVNVALFWSPEVIVVGGAVTQSLDFRTIKRVFRQNLSEYEKEIKIKETELKQEAGLWGALHRVLTLS